MSDSSAKLKNYSIATLCIVVCIFLISILYILNNGIKQYKEQLVLQSEIQGELIQKVSTAYDDYKLYIDSQIAAQQEIVDKANNSSIILSDSCATKIPWDSLTDIFFFFPFFPPIDLPKISPRLTIPTFPPGIPGISKL